MLSASNEEIHSQHPKRVPKCEMLETCRLSIDKLRVNIWSISMRSSLKLAVCVWDDMRLRAEMMSIQWRLLVRPALFGLYRVLTATKGSWP